MIRKIYPVLFVVFLTLVMVPVPVFAAQMAVSGSVVDEAVLSKGGSLMLSAFKPGPGAAADEQTDRISAMLIKGIKEYLSANTSSLTLKDGDDVDGVDFLLEGYIEELAKSGKVARWVLLKNQVYLSVDGEIWLQESGAKVLVFSSSAIINIKKEKLLDAAYQMGRSIGKYIAQQALKE